MDGYNKAKKVADKLKVEKEEKENEEKKQNAEAETQLAQIQANSDLAQAYRSSADLGAENLSGQLPLLKVHAAGRSKNKLGNGQMPEDGSFFYKPEATQYKEITCHVLTISRGFRAEGIEQGENSRKDVFNQILAGVILDENDYKPFYMYFTGLKLSNLWEFGKEASFYTKRKSFPIPMFALKVKLKTSSKENTYGTSWVVDFEILKNEDGSPELVVDPGEFQFLKDGVESAQGMIENIIKAKGLGGVDPSEEDVQEPQEDNRPVPKKVESEDDVSPDEIPF